VAVAKQRAHALDLAVRDADRQGGELAVAAKDAADVGAGLDQRADQVAAPLAVRGLQRRLGRGWAAVHGKRAGHLVCMRALLDHAPQLLLAGAAGDRVVDAQKVAGVAAEAAGRC